MKLEPMRFDLRIHPDQIADVILRAGISHWCCWVKHSEVPVPGVPKNEWAQYQPCVDGSIEFKVSGSGRKYYLDQKALQRAIQIVADKYPAHLPGLVNDHDRDNRTGDVLIQCALFGEVRYS